MRAWLPLADAVLRTVVRIVPDPVVSQRLKSEHFFAPYNVHELNAHCGGNASGTCSTLDHLFHIPTLYSLTYILTQQLNC